MSGTDIVDVISSSVFERIQVSLCHCPCCGCLSHQLWQGCGLKFSLEVESYGLGLFLILLFLVLSEFLSSQGNLCTKCVA